MSRKKKFWLTLGTALLDIGKLAVGGLIFSTIMRWNLDPQNLLIVGAIIALPLLAIGVILITLNKE